MKITVLLTIFLLRAVILSFGQWTETDLSESRSYMGATALGTKAYFAGGETSAGISAKVEIYDVATGELYTTHNLSVPRNSPFATACGGKVLFAGGTDMYGTKAVYSTVDIFDPSTNLWTVEQLSVPRFYPAVVSHGNTVLFAGGVNLQQKLTYCIVDIYDIQTGIWTSATLSEPRVTWWTVAGDLAIFAGGFNFQTASKRVDIYNFTTNTWSIDSLSEARAFVGITTVGSKVLIAGGMTAASARSDVVDIYDSETGKWTKTHLPFARAFSDNQNAVTLGNKAYFVGGGDIDLNTVSWRTAYKRIDIYDLLTDTWSVDSLSEAVIHHAVVAINNKLIVAAGVILNPPYFYIGSKVEIYNDPLIINSLPKEDSYFKIYPNPFSESISIGYTLKQPAKVNLKIFNSYGQLIVELINEFQQNGEQRITWNAGSLPEGVYYCQLKAGNKIKAVKIVKMK